MGECSIALMMQRQKDLAEEEGKRASAGSIGVTGIGMVRSIVSEREVVSRKRRRKGRRKGRKERRLEKKPRRVMRKKRRKGTWKTRKGVNADVAGEKRRIGRVKMGKGEKGIIDSGVSTTGIMTGKGGEEGQVRRRR